MLPKKNRLTKKKDFEIIFKKGEGAKIGFLAFKVLVNKLPKSRFGFVVSRKVSSKAVTRNKIKRLLRSVIFSFLPVIKKNVDMIIVALPGAENKKFKDIKKVIISYFKKLKLI